MHNNDVDTYKGPYKKCWLSFRNLLDERIITTHFFFPNTAFILRSLKYQI